MVRCILFLLVATTSACGLASSRRSQDWRGIDDQRLLCTCHVGDYGCGVLLDYDGDQLRVLTCAHLVAQGEHVALWFFDEAAGRYVSYDGTVTARTHPHREDLALVVAPAARFHLPPQVVPIAAPLADGASCAVALANIAFGAEPRPFVLDAPALAHVANIRSLELRRCAR
jgi:hypothetical protein